MADEPVEPEGEPTPLERLLALGDGEDVTMSAGQLTIPKEFQRELKPRNWGIFVLALFGRLVVAEVIDRSTKTYYVVDGLHRMTEAQRHGHNTFKCILYRGTKKIPLTFADAATMFDELNTGRVALNAAVAFRAACISGDHDARALDKELLARDLDGWQQHRAGGDHKYTDLGAIRSVRYLMEQMDTMVDAPHGTGLEHVCYTLDVIREIWPWVVPYEWDDTTPLAKRPVVQSPHARCVRGFGQFLRPSKHVRGRKTPRTWNPDDRNLLIRYIRDAYSGDKGHEHFLDKAIVLSPGGGGGGGSLGMERQLAKSLNEARKLYKKQGPGK